MEFVLPSRSIWARRAGQEYDLHVTTEEGILDRPPFKNLLLDQRHPRGRHIAVSLNPAEVDARSELSTCVISTDPCQPVVSGWKAFAGAQRTHQSTRYIKDHHRHGTGSRRVEAN